MTTLFNPIRERGPASEIRCIFARGVSSSRGWQAFGALRPLDAAALRLRALASLLLALERRRIAHPKGSRLRRFSKRNYSRDLRPAKWVSIKMRRKIPALPLSGRGHVWTARPGKNFLTDDIGRARWSLKCGRVLDQGSRRATHLLRLPRGGLPDLYTFECRACGVSHIETA